MSEKPSTAPLNQEEIAHILNLFQFDSSEMGLLIPRAVAELTRLRAENAKMRAVLDRCAKITADGEWAVAGDWLWYPLGGQPRKFRVDANMTVPVSVPTAGSWRDLAVEEAYFHQENAAKAALAAKGAE